MGQDLEHRAVGRWFGLQRRIMLYVIVGLAAMFSVITFLGLGAIGEATQLVYQDRLTTAYTAAASLERDFAHLAGDVLETDEQFAAMSGPGFGQPSAATIFGHLDQGNPYTFFEVTGLWLLDASGRVLGEAGNPTIASIAPPLSPSSVAAELQGPFTVLRAAGSVPGSTPFATVVVRLGAPDDSTAPIAVAHTTAINSTNDFIPAWYGRPGAAPATNAPAAGSAERFHLEVVDPSGIAVLGIGPDEHPGQLSPHYAAIRTLIGTGSAAAQLHEAGPGETFEPHVMAVVPLANSPFYVVIEQAVDVALALPNKLRDQLLLASGAGFVSALAVAWITTRRVVKPTEQLTAAAERIAAGDLASPITVRAQDEVGRLAESLETMRSSMQAAHEAIDATNRDLERRVAERTARLGQVLGKTINAQEEERRRLARELHDETAQTLAALSIVLDRARDDIAGASPDTLDRIGEARAIAARLLAETRRLILGLRPAVLDDLGLIAAIRWYSDATLVEAGIDVSMDADPSAPRLPDHVEAALFRIAQEAITNIAKHAGASHVGIRVDFDPSSVSLTVEDDGHGFDVDEALAMTGPGSQNVGLSGMLERVQLLNGQLQIHSNVGRGTLVSLRAPIEEESD